MAYAARTTVPVDRTRAEIEKILYKYHASAFAYMGSGTQHILLFEMQGRRMRFTLPMPEEATFRKGRTSVQAKAAYEQELRRRWRALALMIKAKLEAIESGIVTMEEEFLPYTVVAEGHTVYEWLQPQLERVYDGGYVPPLIPGPR